MILDMKKIYALGSIIIIANLLNTSTVIAQDARFAQSYSNPLRLNPAIMGASKDVKLSLNYRSQFANVDGGYKTVSFTGMYPLMEKNSKNKFDIGVNVMNDKAGAYKTVNFALAFITFIPMSNLLLLFFIVSGYNAVTAVVL